MIRQAWFTRRMNLFDTPKRNSECEIFDCAQLIYHILLSRGSIISVVTIRVARIDRIPCGLCDVAGNAGTAQYGIQGVPIQFYAVEMCRPSYSWIVSEPCPLSWCGLVLESVDCIALLIRGVNAAIPLPLGKT